MPRLIWVDGKLQPHDAPALRADDSAYCEGRGCYTTARVSGGEPIGDLPCIPHRFDRRHHALGESLTQRLTFQELRHREGDALILTKIMNGKYIGMGESRYGSCFTLETLAAGG